MTDVGPLLPRHTVVGWLAPGADESPATVRGLNESRADRRVLVSFACMAVGFLSWADHPLRAGTVQPLHPMTTNITELIALAESGNAEAQLSLGTSYLYGLGVKKDAESGLRWLRQAAAQGHADSAQYLGVLLWGDTNNAVEVRSEGIDWAFRAVEAGDAPDSVKLILSTAVIAKSQSPEDDSAFYERVATWYRRFAERGHAWAQAGLGQILELGLGVEQDPVAALDWYRRAAEAGIPEAHSGLANMLYEGRGTRQDFADAMKHFMAAAMAGRQTAQYMVGLMWDRGQGVPRDEIEAAAWFNLAATAGEPSFCRARDSAEFALDPASRIAAQRRSRELLKVIQSTQGPEAVDAMARTGTGTILAPGFVLTAAHVVAGARRVRLRVEDRETAGTLVSVDAANDLALIRADGLASPIIFGGSKGVRAGQRVFTIGFPNIQLQGWNPKVTEGIINADTGACDDPRTWQISVPVHPGNSGGPLLDEYGRLVGVVVAKLDALKAAGLTGDIPQNVAYAIKADYVLPMLAAAGVDPVGQGKGAASPDRQFEEVVASARASVVIVLAEPDSSTARQP